MAAYLIATILTNKWEKRKLSDFEEFTSTVEHTHETKQYRGPSIVCQSNDYKTIQELCKAAIIIGIIDENKSVNVFWAL